MLVLALTTPVMKLVLAELLQANVDLNISYYDQKVDDVLKDGDVDFKAKGVNAGVTFKF